MPIAQKRPATPTSKSRSTDDGHTLKRHAAPSSREEKHIGATEDQVGVTPAPRVDDDEPKQG